MMKTTSQLYARAGATAIAAALVLSSTSVWAQEVQPVPSDPATTTAPAVDPAPDVTSTPATTDVAPDTTAPTDATKSTTAPVKRTHVATTAKAKPPVAARKVASHPVAATVPASHTAAAAAPAAPVSAAPAAPKPVVDMTAPADKPAPAPAAKSSNGMSQTTELELGGGVLALLALGAGAFALSRRRRHEDEEYYEEAYEPETVAEAEPVAPVAEAAPMAAPQHDPVMDMQPAIVAPSAFAWDNRQPAAADTEDDGSDRRPGETWMERAYRGPSPANPSVSLKARLRRAAFFDKRERDVAAGRAEPVETDAGLPDAMVEEQEREFA